jgi:hypothetical protein
VDKRKEICSNIEKMKDKRDKFQLNRIDLNRVKECVQVTSYRFNNEMVLLQALSCEKNALQKYSITKLKDMQMQMKHETYP